jgi:hypothetical protein
MIKRKKQKAIPNVNLPGMCMTVIGRRNKMHRAFPISRQRMAGFYQLHIYRLFKDYESFFTELVNSIPQKDILLYIGLDLPFFVKRIFENRLKTEILSDDGDPVGSK